MTALFLSRRGSVVTELALIFPLMMIMFLGCFEVTQLVRAYMGLSTTAQNVADMLARQAPIPAGAISDACNGAKLAMSPVSGNHLSAAVVSVTKDVTNGSIGVDWQDTTCGGASAIANASTLATGVLLNKGDNVIVVKTTFTYNALISFVLPASVTLSQVAFARPRTGTAGS